MRIDRTIGLMLILGAVGVFIPYTILTVIFNYPDILRQESGVMVPDMDKMIKIVEAKGSFHTRRLVVPLAKHNEPAWQKVFPAFYQFIMQ